MISLVGWDTPTLLWLSRSTQRLSFVCPVRAGHRYVIDTGHRPIVTYVPIPRTPCRSPALRLLRWLALCLCVCHHDEGPLLRQWELMPPMSEEAATVKLRIPYRGWSHRRAVMRRSTCSRRLPAVVSDAVSSSTWATRVGSEHRIAKVGYWNGFCNCWGGPTVADRGTWFVARREASS